VAAGGSNGLRTGSLPTSTHTSYPNSIIFNTCLKKKLGLLLSKYFGGTQELSGNQSQEKSREKSERDRKEAVRVCTGTAGWREGGQCNLHSAHTSSNIDDSGQSFSSNPLTE